ncbi:hypothetical protein SORBI_3002G079200 [Sorghum bicolor]|uniref:EF-hand domain-containing protein n=1 Tax=Sorghum bicolor TaxID=4558 RepID=A0A1W0W2W6_SORBI|nr:hypothetical protein SORBI_3002G079200 [Sorghum bicolor]
MVNRDFLLSLASSLPTLVLRPLIADSVSVAGKIVASARAALEFLARDDTVRSPHSEEPPVVLTCGDAETVTSRLGLPRWTCSGGGGSSSECRACGAAEVVAEVMAAGVVGGGSERELEEAFHVFDRGEDGFICAAELWAVMRRLGFPEGARYEDCRRMIRAFDDDGDGRISLPEFRRMMENAAC